MEQVAPGLAGKPIPPGNSYDLQQGTEITVSHGFSLGIEGVFKEAFGAGITYECRCNGMALLRPQLTMCKIQLRLLRQRPRRKDPELCPIKLRANG